MPPTETVTLAGTLPPLETPTRESLLAEAEALGESFAKVTAHTADLCADAEVALGALADLGDLEERGYAVSLGLLHRISMLGEELIPASAGCMEPPGDNAPETIKAQAVQQRLLAIIGDIAVILEAASVPGEAFSLEANSAPGLNVVMMRMQEMLAAATASPAREPDKTRLDDLMTEARQLMDAQDARWRRARLRSTDHFSGGLQVERLKRMLLDALLHLSAQGLAANPGDPLREQTYRLDGIHGRRPSVVGDPAAERRRDILL